MHLFVGVNNGSRICKIKRQLKFKEPIAELFHERVMNSCESSRFCSINIIEEHFKYKVFKRVLLSLCLDAGQQL